MDSLRGLSKTSHVEILRCASSRILLNPSILQYCFASCSKKRYELQISCHGNNLPLSTFSSVVFSAGWSNSMIKMCLVNGRSNSFSTFYQIENVHKSCTRVAVRELGDVLYTVWGWAREERTARRGVYYGRGRKSEKN